MIHFEKKCGSLSIILEAVFMGADLCVCIFGGDTPHIGATTLSIPRESLEDRSKLSASTSVLTVTGHKEDELARTIGTILASQLNCRVAVCCGVHFDAATQKQILIIEEIVDELLGELISSISAKRTTTSRE